MPEFPRLILAFKSEYLGEKKKKVLKTKLPLARKIIIQFTFSAVSVYSADAALFARTLHFLQLPHSKSPTDETSRLLPVGHMVVQFSSRSHVVLIFFQTLWSSAAGPPFVAHVHSRFFCCRRTEALSSGGILSELLSEKILSAATCDLSKLSSFELVTKKKKKKWQRESQ